MEKIKPKNWEKSGMDHYVIRGGGQNLSGPAKKKPFFMCVFPYTKEKFLGGGGVYILTFPVRVIVINNKYNIMYLKKMCNNNN